MPHIIIEHSAHLHVQPAMQALHQYVTKCGLFSPQAVKARSLAFADVILPEGAESFVHITVAILDGRSLEERQSLADALFALSQKTLPAVDKLSLDIREMASATYRK